MSAGHVFDRANTDEMNRHLVDIGRVVPQGRLALVVLDGGGRHRSKSLAILDNVSLPRLPPYGPELKPVETGFQFLKQGNFANQVFATAEEVKTGSKRFGTTSPTRPAGSFHSASEAGQYRSAHRHFNPSSTPRRVGDYFVSLRNPILAGEPVIQHDGPHETPIIHNTASFPMNMRPATTLIANPSHPANNICSGLMVNLPFGRTNSESARFMTPLMPFLVPSGSSCPGVFHHFRSSRQSGIRAIFMSSRGARQIRVSRSPRPLRPWRTDHCLNKRRTNAPARDLPARGGIPSRALVRGRA